MPGSRKTKPINYKQLEPAEGEDRFQKRWYLEPHEDHLELKGAPFDINAQISFYRILEEKEDDALHNGQTINELVGATIEVDCWVYNEKVYIRLDRKKKSVRVYVKTEKGYKEIYDSRK